VTNSAYILLQVIVNNLHETNKVDQGAAVRKKPIRFCYRATATIEHQLMAARDIGILITSELFKRSVPWLYGRYRSDPGKAEPTCRCRRVPRV
jgi:hypothetical protein